MLIYVSLFLVPSFAFLGNFKLHGNGQLTWVITLVALTLIIGLRHSVGGDWGSYLNAFKVISLLNFSDALARPDPGYSILNWIAAQVGGNIYLVNTISSAIFTCGLGAFCARQPKPWLALLVAVPYLIIVVGMGYTRQSIALSLLLIALLKVQEGSFGKFLFYAGIAALFHKTALLLVPIAALAFPQGRGMKLLIVASFMVITYNVLIAHSQQRMLESYIFNEYTNSEGGPVRVLMNAIPASIFLIFKDHFILSEPSRRLWTLLSLLALAAVPLVLIASIAVDRMSLYLLPIQMLVYSRISEFVGNVKSRQSLEIFIIVGYSLSLIVWLLFAQNAGSWVPYASILN